MMNKIDINRFCIDDVLDLLKGKKPKKNFKVTDLKAPFTVKSKKKKSGSKYKI